MLTLRVRLMTMARSERRSSTFAALAVPSYRSYFFGAAVSQTGSWMQTIALGWMVVRLGGGGVELGIMAVLQFSPALVGGMIGGVIADRYDRRRLLIITQSAFAVVATGLTALSATGSARLWSLGVCAFLAGCVTTVDNPTRHSLAIELVGPGLVANALTLNSVAFNAARVVGPAIAGVVIATLGTSWCFGVNAVSFVAVIVPLMRVNVNAMYRPERSAPAGTSGIREGLRYAFATPEVRVPLLMITVVGTFAFNWNVSVLLLARALDGGAGAYGALMTGMGVGAVTGGLVAAGRAASDHRRLCRAAIALGALLLAASLAPNLPLAIGLLAASGVANITFVTTANARLQLAARPDMRGRVMALWTMAFVGSTPIGGMIAGLAAELVHLRAGLAIGGTGAALAGIVALAADTRGRREAPAAVPPDGGPAALTQG